MAMLALLMLAVSILGFAAWASVSQWGLAGIEQQWPPRLKRNALRLQLRQRQQRQRLCRAQRQYALVQHDAGPGHVDWPIPHDYPDHGAGRFAWRKNIAPPSAGTFPVAGGTFVVLVLGTVLLVGALNFLPGLTLGPIVEHFQTLQGKLY